MSKYAAFNINFDSLGLSCGFPPSFHDPSFFEIADRFLALASKYNFKLSIFVIGKDLEKPENRDAVKKWSELGHEIGNHTWSHRSDIGFLEKEKICREVERAHEIIFKTVGYEPKGFIAPAWASSEDLLDVLLSLNYEYDSSPFPSWLMYLLAFRIWFAHKKMNTGSGLLTFQNLTYSFLGSRKAFISTGDFKTRTEKSNFSQDKKKITILPLPTNRWRVACWHTLAFMSNSLHKRILRDCLKEIDAFYYLMHPADLIERQDLAQKFPCYFARIDIPLEIKTQLMESSIQTIINSGRKIVTMKELAQTVHSN